MLFTPVNVSDTPSLRRFVCCSAHGVGISRHSFLSMEAGHAAVGRKITGFDFSRLLELEPSAALDPVDNPETLEVLSRILCGPEDYDYHVRQRPPLLCTRVSLEFNRFLQRRFDFHGSILLLGGGLTDSSTWGICAARAPALASIHLTRITRVIRIGTVTIRSRTVGRSREAVTSRCS